MDSKHYDADNEKLEESKQIKTEDKRKKPSDQNLNWDIKNVSSKDFME